MPSLSLISYQSTNAGTQPALTDNINGTVGFESWGEAFLGTGKYLYEVDIQTNGWTNSPNTWVYTLYMVVSNCGGSSGNYYPLNTTVDTSTIMTLTSYNSNNNWLNFTFSGTMFLTNGVPYIWYVYFQGVDIFDTNHYLYINENSGNTPAFNGVGYQNVYRVASGVSSTLDAGTYQMKYYVYGSNIEGSIPIVTLSASGSGSISGYDYTTATVLNEGANNVVIGNNINVHAIPDSGSQFFYFTVNSTEYVNGAFDYTVTGSVDITAYFRLLPSNINYTLTVTNPFSLGGSVQWYDTNNGSTPSFGVGVFTNIPTSDGLEFTATPNSGYNFVDWYVTNTTDGSYISSFTTNPLNMGFAENVTVYPEWKLNPLNTPTPSTIFGLGALGISNIEIAVVIYVICIIGLIAGFYYLHNNNIPFAFALGLVLATILCQIINILGIYTYPIDALMIVSVVGIIIFMRH